MQVTYSFPGAQEDIGDELSTSRGNGPADSLVLGGVLTCSGGVDILEDLVETELSKALSRIANQRGGPAKSEALETLGSPNLSEAITDALVETRECLKENGQ